MARETLKNPLQWAGRDILDADHIKDLDTKAAMHEFKDRLPRDQAEEKAHNAYRRDQHMVGAAHHLQGMKASQALGQVEEGKKHAAMYHLHMKQLGMDPDAEPPAEIRQRIKAPDAQKLLRFKAHPADMFALTKSQSTQNQETPVADPKTPMKKTSKPDPERLAQLRKNVTDLFDGKKDLAKNEAARAQKAAFVLKAAIEAIKLVKGEDAPQMPVEGAGASSVIKEEGSASGSGSASASHFLKEEGDGNPPTAAANPAFQGAGTEPLKRSDLSKVAPPEFSEGDMHKLKAKHGVESAFKIAWAAHNKHHGKMEKSEGVSDSDLQYATLLLKNSVLHAGAVGTPSFVYSQDVLNKSYISPTTKFGPSNPRNVMKPPAAPKPTAPSAPAKPIAKAEMCKMCGYEHAEGKHSAIKKNQADELAALRKKANDLLAKNDGPGFVYSDAKWGPGFEPSK